jgi:hypothetical protein
VIEPVLLFPQTVAHWKLPASTPHTAYFKVTRSTDPETQLTFWDIEEAPSPADSIIPLETIILIANPRDIVIPTGITLTNTGNNLQLPPIYVQPTFDTVDNALDILTVTHLFGPVGSISVKKERYVAEQPVAQ